MNNVLVLDEIDSLNGGKVIGEGGQACVFRPALYGPNRQSHVTKLMPRNDAQVELQISNMLRALDPGQKYGVYPTSGLQCYFNQAQKAIVKSDVRAFTTQDGRCIRLDAALMANKPVCALNYPVYSQDLWGHMTDVMDNKMGPWPTNIMFAAFKNLLAGLVAFHNGQVVHGDIKEPNIAVIFNRGRPIFKYADFGLATNIATCEGVDQAFATYLSHPTYTPLELKPWAKPGDKDYSNGIRAPIIWGTPNTCEARKAIAYYNDVFELAGVFKQLCRVYGITNSKAYRVADYVFQLGRSDQDWRYAANWTAQKFMAAMLQAM